jgi:hypothetical protein
MRYLIFFLLAELSMADGVVLYEKATGNIVGDNNTNAVVTFWKLQPSETKYDGNVVYGAQVYFPVNWTNFDLASYTETTTNDPKTILDLTGVKSFDVLKQQSVDVVVSNTANTIITPAVQALLDCMNKRLPATNQITAAELTTATTNRIKQSASAIQ